MVINLPPPAINSRAGRLGIDYVGWKENVRQTGPMTAESALSDKLGPICWDHGFVGQALYNEGVCLCAGLSIVCRVHVHRCTAPARRWEGTVFVAR